MTGILAFILQVLSGPTINRVLDHLDTTARSGSDADRLSAQVTSEQIRAVVENNRTMADFNKAKLSHLAFWALISLFVVPLGLWWAAVLADSIFNLPFQIADLPNPHMREWAGDMIRWLFYVGTGVGALKMVTR